MAALLPVELVVAVEKIVADLASGRGSADLSRRLGDYGRTLVPLPSGWQKYAWRYGAGGADEAALDVDLWTLEEGRSDLTLQLHAHRDGKEWLLEITDLRVL